MPLIFSHIFKIFLLFITCLVSSRSAFAIPKCLYIASYHQGYEWSDGVEKGLRKQLEGSCEFKQFNMDTKRNPSEVYKKSMGLKAKNLILSWQPDVVIASDDNASQYVVKPYFKDHVIPFVFCGINWNVDAYGYPYKNATGMVEVAPITALLDQVENTLGKVDNAFYLGVDVLTERKNLARFKEEAQERKIKLAHGLAKTSQQWLEFYQQAQNYDFIIIGGNAGLNDWIREKMIKKIKKYSNKLSVTIQGWMMPYAMLGLTKIPEEQGEWAGQVALYILDGANPSDIPIVSNRKWDIWINQTILNNTDIEIHHSLIKKAKKYSTK